jgi:NAD(P) transhydrogenase subunit alpha
MIIGIPKEIMQGENRVAGIPETVEKFINLGFEVNLPLVFRHHRGL